MTDKQESREAGGETEGEGSFEKTDAGNKLKSECSDCGPPLNSFCETEQLELTIEQSQIQEMHDGNVQTECATNATRFEETMSNTFKEPSDEMKEDHKKDYEEEESCKNKISEVHVEVHNVEEAIKDDLQPTKYNVNNEESHMNDDNDRVGEESATKEVKAAEHEPEDCQALASNPHGTYRIEVGEEVYRRLQELRGHFSIDDLLKYFFALHEWYMISSSGSAESLNGACQTTDDSNSEPQAGVTSDTNKTDGVRQTGEDADTRTGSRGSIDCANQDGTDSAIKTGISEGCLGESETRPFTEGHGALGKSEKFIEEYPCASRNTNNSHAPAVSGIPVTSEVKMDCELEMTDSCIRSAVSQYSHEVTDSGIYHSLTDSEAIDEKKRWEVAPNKPSPKTQNKDPAAKDWPFMCQNHGGIITCKICSFQTRKTHRMRSHIKSHTKGRYKCNICGEPCFNKFRKHLHECLSHDTHLQTKCSKRSLKYQNLLVRRRHLLRRRCSQCYGIVWNKEKHARFCRGNVLARCQKKLIFCCVKCGSCFQNQSLLQQHIILDHKQRKQYQCICGYQNNVSTMYQRHKKICKYTFHRFFNLSLQRMSRFPSACDQEMNMSSGNVPAFLNPESVYATGLHVLADVSEHQSTHLLSTVFAEKERRDCVNNFTTSSLTRLHGTSDQKLAMPPSEINTLSHLQHCTSEIMNQSDADDLGKKEEDVELRANISNSNKIPSVACMSTSFQTPPVLQEKQMAELEQTFVAHIGSQEQKQMQTNNDLSKRERIRRNSGQGLERAISALKCKALSEMSRRKTTDDGIFVRNDSGSSACHSRQKERQSVDSLLSIRGECSDTNFVSVHQEKKCSGKNQSECDRSDAFQSPFGTAVVDLSKVHVAALSEQNLSRQYRESGFVKSEKDFSAKRDAVVPCDIPGRPAKVHRESEGSASQARVTDDAYEKGHNLPSVFVSGNNSQCPNCLTSYSSARELEQHLGSVCKPFINNLISSQTGSLKCKICTFDFETHKRAFLHHLQSVHGISVVASSVQPRKSLICKVCGQKFSTDAYLREHVNGKHFSARYSCTCGKTFKWRSSFSGHKRKCNGIITSTINNRGRGKPLSITRKTFRIGDSDRGRMYLNTIPRLNEPNTELQSKKLKHVENIPKLIGSNTVPGIETLLANVRKDKRDPSTFSGKTTQEQKSTDLCSSGLLGRRQSLNTPKDFSSLRISPKMRSYMEPIVQKATKENISRTADNAHRHQQQASGGSTDHLLSKRQFSSATGGANVDPVKQMGFSEAVASENRHIEIGQTNNLSANTLKHPIKQEQTGPVQGKPKTLMGSSADSTPQQKQSGLHTNIIIDGKDSKTKADKNVQEPFQIGLITPNPYLLYPNMFNIYPTAFQQTQSTVNRLPAPQQTQTKSSGKSGSFPTTSPDSCQTSVVRSANSFVPFFTEALNTLQHTIMNSIHNPGIPLAENKSNTMAKSEKTNSASNASRSSNAPSAYITCNKCKKTFPPYESHICKPQKLYCDICKMSFKCKASAREHMLGKHGGENRYSCPCGLKFKWRSSLGCHQRNCPKAPQKRVKVPV